MIHQTTIVNSYKYDCRLISNKLVCNQHIIKYFISFGFHCFFYYFLYFLNWLWTDDVYNGQSYMKQQNQKKNDQISWAPSNPERAWKMTCETPQAQRQTTIFITWPSNKQNKNQWNSIPTKKQTLDNQTNRQTNRNQKPEPRNKHTNKNKPTNKSKMKIRASKWTNEHNSTQGELKSYPPLRKIRLRCFPYRFRIRNSVSELDFVDGIFVS